MMSEISSGWPHMWPISMAKGSSETLLMMMKSFTLSRRPPVSFLLPRLVLAALLGHIDRHGRGMPDVAVVFHDGAIRGELAHARHVEDGHARPPVLVAIQVGNLRLAGHVIREVGHQHVLILENEAVDQGI